MATDGHVISPLFFPGGDIGCLAVHGTVNDVAMLGARPLYLSGQLHPRGRLAAGRPEAHRRLDGRRGARGRRAHRHRRHQGGRAGQGRRRLHQHHRHRRAPARPAHRRRAARPGDVLLVSGTIGDHGVAVLSQRESLEFETTIVSDTAALHGLVAALLAAVPEGAVRTLRDPTRGGLATTLNEIARQSAWACCCDEAAIPVQPQVRAACELLGLDPLYIANEGKLVAIVAPEAADAALAALRAHPLGTGARASAACTPTRTASCRCTRASAAGASSTGSRASRCRASADGRGPPCASCCWPMASTA
jgi:hydrogenase expression/formation protein HypE